MQKKIAILGKGGSGKSSVSWLLSNYLSQEKNVRTLAIDTDHNMDLASCLGCDLETIKFLKDFNDEFRILSNMAKLGMWREYFQREPIQFSYPNDCKLEKYITNVKKNLDIIVVGLGDENNMYTNKCSHAFSAPLKYMLPTLQLSSNTSVIIDSVAGSDMVNYGLYFACDAICIVVEGHINSIKVAKQIAYLCKKQELKTYFILNKYDPNNLFTLTFEKENQKSIIGKIPNDQSIVNYNYDQINPSTKRFLEELIAKINILPQADNPYQHLKSFELQKQ